MRLIISAKGASKRQDASDASPLGSCAATPSTAGDTIEVELRIACVADPVSGLELLLISHQPVTSPERAVLKEMEQVSRRGAHEFACGASREHSGRSSLQLGSILLQSL